MRIAEFRTGKDHRRLRECYGVVSLRGELRLGRRAGVPGSMTTEHAGRA
jgi:hypothetical protein